MIISHLNESKFFQLKNVPKKAMEWLKRDVPSEYRFYLDGFWHVHEDHLLDIVTLAYTELEFIDYLSVNTEWKEKIRNNTRSENKVRNLKNTSKADAYAVLYLVPSAPKEIIDVVWRKLAQIHHPDQGGDEEMFKRINAAYQVIKE